MAPAMQPAEIQFAQRLASHEKGIRERAVKKLRQYLSVKTQREAGGFSQEELLKIWKGLFYCMWVQEEPRLQEELADSISQLVHVVNNSEAQHLFIETFWRTMNREWKGIDGPRLDKYCMLARLVLRQSLEALKRNGWEPSRVQLFLDGLVQEVLRPESPSPDAVRAHFIDMYLAELSRVGGGELLADQNLKFIDPFCRIAARTKDHTLVQTIARGVFEVIVDQSPFAPESGGDLSEEETPGNKEAWTEAARRPALGKCHSRRDGTCDQRESDTRGALEDAGPPLQFDYKAVADRLLEMTNKKNTPPFNRKHLCKLIRKFRDLSEGTGVVAVEEDGGGGVPESRRKRKNPLPPQASGAEAAAVSLRQNGAQAAAEATASSPGEESGSEHLPVTPSPSKRKRLKKRSLQAQREARASASPLPASAQSGPGATRGSPAGRAQALKRKRRLGAVLVKGSSLLTLAWPAASPAEAGADQAALPRREKSQSNKSGPGGLDVPGLARQKSAILKKRRKMRAAELLGPEVRPTPALGSRGPLSPVKKLLRTENDFVKFDTSLSPKPLFFRRAKSSPTTCSPCPAVQLDRTPASAKKVTFGLSRNTTAEFKKTDKSILVSPTGPSRVAFNPEQRPLHGVLKTPTSSPASTPPVAKKPLAATPKKRPTAMDFF
ncbi:ribosomal RNA processing protein 1 homolog B [Lepus europaeus]|uniref:ribosomal RNA processing protein 1 homolog B n=1 Tax=Lepus europaeus TaxID=9983 RepID=UPI002B459876|nr:ribosomal RNA processing protein 1 homolog B [Lepus europaeus]